jgi:predicted HicB family RNase H-like nuclease
MKAERTNSTTMRLPRELHDALVLAAEERDLSVNHLVNRAVEEFLDRLIPADELRLTRG